MTLIDRLFGRDPAKKAVYGGAWLSALQQGPSLSVYGNDWQQRAKAYLEAYRVGWFYKAGSRISRDFANLPWTLAYEDVDGDNAEDIVAPANNVPWERLEPLEQFLRLSEAPNPWQTGRSFKQQQQIRLDFTGRALIYLEGGEGGGLPTALYGISPTRMWPSHNNQGQLIGWVLDKDAPSGPRMTFERDEILVLEYPGADFDPIGVVEAVYAHVPLTRQLPQHTSDMLSTGGRLAGMAWPKNRALDEAEFAEAQRAWRNVTSDPNAARRLLLFPEPMEYQSGAATPEQIGIPELSSINRDEILTTFPINPYMVGVPQATGLNSGESLRYIRRDYWDGTQHPRVEVWEDSFQQQLIPRYEGAVGRPLDFDIDEPDLDDAESLTQKVEAYKGLVAIGFDPKEAVTAVGLDHIPWVGLPALLDPANQAALAEQAARAQTEPEPARTSPGDNRAPDTDPNGRPPRGVAPTSKAKQRPDELPGFRKVMREALDDQLARIIDALEGTKARHDRRVKALPDDWWDPAKEDGFLRDRLRPLYVRLARSALEVVGNDRDRTVDKLRINRIANEMLDKAGDRIHGINETTHKAVKEAVGEGVRRGYSIPQIVNGVQDEGYRGLRSEPAFDEARAEMIARTETMLAYNDSALRGYREFGVEQVEAIDGDEDEECAARHGQVYAIEDALNIEDHPNGTLDWAPIVPDKAVHRDDDAQRERVAWQEAIKAIAELANAPKPEIHVHNAPPAVNAPITVQVPEQPMVPESVPAEDGD